MVQRQRDRRLAPARRPRPCRLEVILADESPRAVIFRRGPRHLVRQILWDRATDSFEPGQWLAGKRVYVEKSALSPNGEYLLAFIKLVAESTSFTVLSRPPFFTALALWPWGGATLGGGRFTGVRDIELDQFVTLHAGYDPLAATGPFLARDADHREPYRAPPRFARWRYGEKARQQKASRGFDLLAEPADSYGEAATFAVAAAGRSFALAGVQWADLDGNGDLLFSVRGALHRCPASDVAAAPDQVAARSRRLADFTGMRYSHVLAPYRSGMLREAAAPDPPCVSREDRRRRRAERDLARRAQAWKGVVGD